MITAWSNFTWPTCRSSIPFRIARSVVLEGLRFLTTSFSLPLRFEWPFHFSVFIWTTARICMRFIRTHSAGRLWLRAKSPRSHTSTWKMETWARWVKTPCRGTLWVFFAPKKQMSSILLSWLVSVYNILPQDITSRLSRRIPNTISIIAQYQRNIIYLAKECQLSVFQPNQTSRNLQTFPIISLVAKLLRAWWKPVSSLVHYLTRRIAKLFRPPDQTLCWTFCWLAFFAPKFFYTPIVFFIKPGDVLMQNSCRKIQPFSE